MFSGFVASRVHKVELLFDDKEHFRHANYDEVDGKGNYDAEQRVCTEVQTSGQNISAIKEEDH